MLKDVMNMIIIKEFMREVMMIGFVSEISHD